MKKRTNVAFSKHEVKVETFEGVLIHEFKRPNTIACMLVFINTRNTMTVTGDFGNWVFCREFHPSENTEGVNDGYWDEKLEIHSQQKSKQFDSEKTKEAITEFKESYESYYGEEMDEEVAEWVERLEGNTDNEMDYSYVAYREKPDSVDYENVPFGVTTPRGLTAVYDGFEAMCEALKRLQDATRPK